MLYGKWIIIFSFLFLMVYSIQELHACSNIDLLTNNAVFLRINQPTSVGPSISSTRPSSGPVVLTPSEKKRWKEFRKGLLSDLDRLIGPTTAEKKALKKQQEIKAKELKKLQILYGN